ncbi:carboxymuconolactone decarboxylase family protein [Streptomyces sp. CA-179760]|uniref:carboxymuconolactone decarboxylase family protein n=1 Tax=Streptomyces sp. CA-179760 TaxID=3240054 RepID=UPI003D8E83E8
MPDQPKQVGSGRRLLGDFSPKLAELTDDVLFEDVWNRTELAARDRSLITVAALVAGGDADQLRFHLALAKNNGVTETELVEAMTHLAFYAGWPKAMTAIMVAKQVFSA